MNPKPRSERRPRKFGFLGGILLLTMTAAPTEANTVVANSPNWESSSAVAFNSDRDEYLAVWSKYSLTDHDIFARRIDHDGSPIGPAFPIVDTSQNERMPTVAYSEEHQEYMVAYEVGTDSTDIDIYARRISGTGSLLGTAVQVTSSSKHEQTPRIVYHSNLKTYVVAWELLWSWPDFDVEARTISATGSLGSFVMLANSPASEHSPDLDCRTTTPECLFVWQQDQTSSDVYALAVDMSSGRSGSPFGVAVGPKDDGAPRVAQGTGGEYLIVWQHAFSTLDWDIHAQRVTGRQTVGSVIGVGAETVNERHPDISYLDDRGRYLISWERYSGNSTVIFPPIDIWTTFVNDQGVLSFLLKTDHLGRDDQRPSIAAGGVDLGSLVVWEHLYSDGDWDITARVVPTPN